MSQARLLCDSYFVHLEVHCRFTSVSPWPTRECQRQDLVQLVPIPSGSAVLRTHYVRGLGRVLHGWVHGSPDARNSPGSWGQSCYWRLTDLDKVAGPRARGLVCCILLAQQSSSAPAEQFLVLLSRYLSPRGLKRLLLPEWPSVGDMGGRECSLNHGLWFSLPRKGQDPPNTSHLGGAQLPVSYFPV